MEYVQQNMGQLCNHQSRPTGSALPNVLPISQLSFRRRAIGRKVLAAAVGCGASPGRRVDGVRLRQNQDLTATEATEGED